MSVFVCACLLQHTSVCEIHKSYHILDYCPDPWILLSPSHLECGVLLSPPVELCDQTVPLHPLCSVDRFTVSPLLHVRVPVSPSDLLLFLYPRTPHGQPCRKGVLTLSVSPSRMGEPSGHGDCGVFTVVFLPVCTKQVGADLSCSLVSVLLLLLF